MRLLSVMSGAARSIRPVGGRVPDRRTLAERVRLGVTLLLGIAVAIQLSRVVTRTVGALKGLQTLRDSTPAPAPLASRLTGVDERLAHRIVAAHLFGAAPIQAASDTTAPQDLKLDLTLVGTLAAANPEKGFAIIQRGSQRTGVFAAHAQIDRATRLLRIFTDHVIVDWRGSERVLTLPQSQNASPSLASASSDDTSEPAPVVPAKSVQGTGEQPMRMANYRRILDEIDYHPRIVGDAIDGVKISGVKDEEKLAKVGLQTGDIVTSVNGVPITDPHRIDDLLKALSEGRAVTATIIRNGESSSEVLQSDR